MSHHLTICFDSRRNQRQTIYMANNAGTLRKKGKGTSPMSKQSEKCVRASIEVDIVGF